MTPVVISRSEHEKVKIEPSINSVRISVKIMQLDGLTEVLVDRYARFLMLRAEQFKILRRRACDGYDISFLVTNFSTEVLLRNQLVDFIIDFLATIDKQVSQLKLDVNSRAREVAKQILRPFTK